MQNISGLPRHRTAFFRAVAATLPFLAGSFVLSQGPVEAEEGKSIAGQFHMGFVFGDPCPAVTGVCVTGSVSGDLSGDIFITFDELNEEEDRRGETITHLSGDVLITTMEGDVRGKLRGIFDQATGTVRHTITLSGGDRRYHKTRGTLRVSGTVDLRNSVEEDDYTGELDR